jgi:nitroreductase
MDFSNLIHARQSVRAYQPAPVPEEKLQALLEAANQAPSAGNFQAFEIYVVRDLKQRQALAAATFGQDFLQNAPLSLVFCMNPARCQYQPPELFAMQDATIACTFAMLKVTDLGLAACWVGAFTPQKLAQALALPENITPVAVLAIGYAAESPERTSRRNLEEVAHKL